MGKKDEFIFNIKKPKKKDEIIFNVKKKKKKDEFIFNSKKDKKKKKKKDEIIFNAKKPKIKDVCKLGYPKERWEYIYVNDEKTHYMISTYGRVKNLKSGKFIKQHVQNGGYYGFTISVNGKTHSYKTASMVGKTFIENDNPENKTQLNHIKGKDKWNNSIYNLEWVTPSENRRHAVETGLRSSGGFPEIHDKKKIKKVCELLEKNVDMYDIEEKTGLPRHVIRNILKGKNHTEISCNYDLSNYVHRQSGPKPKYDDKTIHKICKMWMSGKFASEISKELGIEDSTINRIINGRKIYRHITSQYDLKRVKVHRTLKDTNYTIHDIVKVCEMLEKGKDVEYISEKTSVPKSTVKNIKAKRSYTEVSKDYNF